MIGKKNLSQGLMELKGRRTSTVTKIEPPDVTNRLKELLGPVLNLITKAL